MEQLLHYLPSTLVKEIQTIPEDQLQSLEEIRLRCYRPTQLNRGRKSTILKHIFSEEEAIAFFQLITNHSTYAMQEELKKGFVTLANGHRVGLSGQTILERGQVQSLTHVASFNIRIAKQKLGCSRGILPSLYDNDWQSTLIIGAPQSGKTTLIRDIARIISGDDGCLSGQMRKVGIVDERSEIAACSRAIPQMTFGPSVDVLDGCPKAEGIMMMIRSMSPEVIIVDEVGHSNDIQALIEAYHSGVVVIGTVHAKSYEDARNRPSLAPLFLNHTFDRYIELNRSVTGSMDWIVKDKEGKMLKRKQRGYLEK